MPGMARLKILSKRPYLMSQNKSLKNLFWNRLQDGLLSSRPHYRSTSPSTKWRSTRSTFPRTMPSSPSSTSIRCPDQMGNKSFDKLEHFSVKMKKVILGKRTSLNVILMIRQEFFQIIRHLLPNWSCAKDLQLVHKNPYF